MNVQTRDFFKMDKLKRDCIMTGTALVKRGKLVIIAWARVI